MLFFSMFFNSTICKTSSYIHRNDSQRETELKLLDVNNLVCLKKKKPTKNENKTVYIRKTKKRKKEKKKDDVDR